MTYEPIEIYEKLMEDFNSSQNDFVLKFSEKDKEIIDIYSKFYDDTQTHIGVIKWWLDIQFSPIAFESTRDGFKINYTEIGITIEELYELYKFLDNVRLQRSTDRFNNIRKQGYGTSGRIMPVRTVNAFRVWNSLVNKYIDPDAVEVDPYCNHIYTSYSDGMGLTGNIFIEPCSWRKDCDKNFIYDGDVVEGKFIHRTSMYEVIFDDGNWVYKDMKRDGFTYSYEDFSSIKIIGNIHTFSDKDA